MKDRLNRAVNADAVRLAEGQWQMATWLRRKSEPSQFLHAMMALQASRRSDLAKPVVSVS